MSTDGKQLEGLVSFVEKTLLPPGFDVKTNVLAYNDDGVQIAEFDVEIRGKVGTTSIAWLIECRDRPSAGPAPGSWIEQLVGRRSRFGFNKVTAVSTTSFATGALDYARREGIELRQVDSLGPVSFSDWVGIEQINVVDNNAHLEGTAVIINPVEVKERVEALNKILASNKSVDAQILRANTTNQIGSLGAAFLAAVNAQDLFSKIVPNGPPEKMALRVNYSSDEHFLVDTDYGAVRIEAIEFFGELSKTETEVAISATSEYRHSETGELISKMASFDPSISKRYLFFMHKIASTGERHIVIRPRNTRDS